MSEALAWTADQLFVVCYLVRRLETDSGMTYM
jgi:hypothetical protein